MLLTVVAFGYFVRATRKRAIAQSVFVLFAVSAFYEIGAIRI